MTCFRYLLFGVLATFLFALTAPHTAAAEPIRTPKMTPQLNLGKMAYDAYCASCHGVNAAGTDKGPTFHHKVYHPGHHGDGAFMIAPRRGVRAHHWKFGDMKPVPGVTDSQLKNIIAYVRALQQENGLF